jgi:HSP20 family protein
MSELSVKKESVPETQNKTNEKVVSFSPDCDIEEAKDCYLVQVDMPGLELNDIHVELDRDMLTVEGNAVIDGLETRHYERQFRVMRGLDAAKVKADYKNGVLALKLPKPAEQQARQIKIQCG